jgi:tetratricopeptide (TPR) repeat protein
LSFFGGLTNHPELFGLTGIIFVIACFAWISDQFLPLHRAVQSCNSGDYAKSIEWCDKAIIKLPNHPDPFITAAACYIALSQPEKAMDSCNKALSFSPNNAVAYLNRSMANLQLNKLEQALEDCTIALRNTNKRFILLLAHCYGAYGCIYARLGDIEKAIENCNTALSIYPKCQAALITRAHCFCVSKRFDDALIDLKTNEGFAPNARSDGLALSNRARIHLKMRNIDIALKDAKKANELFPDCPPIIATLAKVLICDQQYNEALIHLSKAIELDTYYAEAYWFRYELYELMGQHDKGEADKEIALGYRYIPYL